MKVRISQDTCSPLWVIRCAEPCGDGGRCANTGSHGGLPHLPPALHGICWMGASRTREGAVAHAEGEGWEVAG